MKVIENIRNIKAEIKRLKGEGKTVGLVPTMGFLHEGHISLVKRSVADNDITVVSIFVNPTQFGVNEDLDAYPKDFEHDSKLLAAAKTDIIFFPSAQEMYPDGFCTSVRLKGLTEVLCGVSRPGHFDGVATVVSKLFNIVSPDRSYFGSKDYQQLQVIRRMALDLNMDTEVIGMPIIREHDGLAMSSRNVYLKNDERESAVSLSKSFSFVEKLLQEGERDVRVIRHKVIEFINAHEHADVDYVELVHPDKLRPLERVNGSFVMALAVKVGRARLIDNKFFKI
jgi:pantoate--beta-alanine ligase